MSRSEYYQRLADKHGSQKVIGLLCDIIAELRAQLGARQSTRRRELAGSQGNDRLHGREGSEAE